MKNERNPEDAVVEQQQSRKTKIIRVTMAVVAASTALLAASQIEPNKAQQTYDEKVEEQYENCLDHMLSEQDVARAHKESFGPFAHTLPDKPQRVMDAMKGCDAYAETVVGPAP